MAVKVMYECPISGKVWTPGDEYKEVVVEKKQDENGNEVEEVKEWPLNYAVVGYYNHKTNQMEHIAYGRDICPDVMRDIAAAVLQGSNSKVKIHEVAPKSKPDKKKKKSGKYKLGEEQKTDLEKDQQEFAEQKEAEDDAD